MNESNWLLFDEPTNHLDVVAKEELKKALKKTKLLKKINISLLHKYALPRLIEKYLKDENIIK